MTFLHLVRRVLAMLAPDMRTCFWRLCAAMTAGSLAELCAVSVIAAYAATISDVQGILSSKAMLGFLSATGLPAPTPERLLAIFSVGVVVSVAAKNALSAWLQHQSNLYGARVSADVGGRYLSGLAQARFEWHTLQNSSELLNVFGWREQIGFGVIRNALDTLSGLSNAVILLAYLFYVNPLACLGTVCFVSLAAVGAYKTIRPRIDQRSRAYKTLALSISRQATELIHGVKDLKISGTSRLLTDMKAELERYSDIYAWHLTYSRMPGDVIEVTGFLAIALLVAAMIMASPDSSGHVVGFITLLALTAWRVLPTANRVLANFAAMDRIAPLANQVLDMSDALETLPREAPQDGPALEFTEALHFEDVRFTYGQAKNPALHGLNFSLPRNQTLGIIGGSGAGKSTCADMFAGILAPQQGRFLVDETPITPDNVARWWPKVGYVPQFPYIIDDSLAFNISFGSGNTDRHWLLECCAMARIDAFLHELPQGLDTIVGERGVRLSGGQRQRVAIARALCKRPALLILDEATSNLDTLSERLIQEAITALSHKLTICIVAHRLSTVEACDRILWLENGKVEMLGDAKAVLESFRACQGRDGALRGRTHTP